jgi:hypothetical protein
MSEASDLFHQAATQDTDKSAETLPLAEEPNLILRFQRDVELAGLVGEKNNAAVVFLVAVSAKLEKPLNVSVGGASAAGKNHLTGSVARFISEEHKKILTGMSPKVLMHAGEDEFRNKAVFIAEYEGVSGADYSIRTMQSEGVIDWEYVETSAKGIQKKIRHVKGPLAFVQATTRPILHMENETRLLFVQVDESVEQTRAVNERQALEAEMAVAPCPAGLHERWHEFLRSLDPLRVRIPFARQLAKEFPGRVQSRRDFPKLLGLVEVLAFLHQLQRDKDELGNIVAHWQDYQIARVLFEHCHQLGPEKNVAELLQAATKVGRDEFSVADLIQSTGWGKTKTYQVLSRAEEIGRIVQVERGSYRILRKDGEPQLNLPAKIKLRASDFRISAERGVLEVRNSTATRQ